MAARSTSMRRRRRRSAELSTLSRAGSWRSCTTRSWSPCRLRPGRAGRHRRRRRRKKERRSLLSLLRPTSRRFWSERVIKQPNVVKSFIFIKCNFSFSNLDFDFFVLFRAREQRQIIQEKDFVPLLFRRVQQIRGSQQFRVLGCRTKSQVVPKVQPLNRISAMPHFLIESQADLQQINRTSA